MKKLISFLFLLFTGCNTGIPDGVSPVANFDINRYLGRWYEIARFDHSFERGLINVSADYSLNKDGSIRVINKGFDSKQKEWKSAEGKGKFISDHTLGRLKVSFFGPFYGAYNIINLDVDNYSYALVCGPDKSYLWILARTPSIEKEILQHLVSRAKDLGFDVDKLIYVEQPQQNVGS